MKRFILYFALGAATVLAQDAGGNVGTAPAATTPGTDGNSAVVLPVPEPTYDNLKRYLNLTDPQLQSLRQNQKNKMDADQLIWRQISEKSVELNNLLESGSNDAVRIGQLSIELRNLQKQARNAVPNSPYRQSALNVLNAEQKTKLTDLQRALDLSPTAYDA
ncbi:MAG TPA: hypothetical protein VE621_15780, partial [Bryobacteraceae bacterium]|nr:hypothetical protein [Bryobacteraceae bacterium]